jgi:flagellar biosynthesis protein FlhG
MLESGYDQAVGLRRLFEKRGVAMYSIAGTAGVTAVTLDLAAALAHGGQRVLIIDRTKGEVSTQLGLKARCEFAHVLSGEKRLDEVLQAGPARIHVLPAARALDAIDAGDGAAHRGLARFLDFIRDRFDICLVNGLAPATGAEETTTRDVLLVTAPGGAAITGIYAQIKLLAGQRTRYRLRIVVNRARTEASARSIYAGLAETARRFLSARLDYCGHLPAEPGAGTAAGRDTGPGPRGRSPRAHAFAVLAASLAAETSSHYVPV